MLLIGTLDAQEKVYFDIKTSLEEKTSLLPVELGATLVFSQSNWAGVLELGEDFCIYLKNYRRKVTHNYIYIAMDVELREPGTLKAGKLLSTREIRVKIDRNEDTSLATELYHLIKTGFELSAVDSHNEAVVIGKLVEESALSMYKSIFQKQTIGEYPEAVFASN